MSFDYTDVKAQYVCDGTGSLIDSIATPTALNFVEQATVGEKVDGQFGNCRGAIGATNHFRTNYTGKWFDVTINASFSGVFWVRQLDANDAFWFSIWDAGANNRQAYIIRHSPVDLCPAFFQYDGAGNEIQLPATTLVDMATDTWQMVGFSYDDTLEELRIFWGRDVGETYYATVDGFAGGWGITTDVQQVQVGRYAGNFDFDHFSFWTRAFVEEDFQNHWVDGDGLAFEDFLLEEPDAGGATGPGTQSHALNGIAAAIGMGRGRRGRGRGAGIYDELAAKPRTPRYVADIDATLAFIYGERPDDE